MNLFEKEYYEFESFWNSSEFNISNQERIKATFDFLPEDAESLLDVACGNGLFCNYVAMARPQMRVIGLDRSATALSHVTAEKVEGSITQLPFEDNEFDCVSALQVLEHLTIADFEQAKREIARVAKHYVIVSVPYKQCLEDDYTRCPNCRTTFNSDLHFRSFGDEATMKLLAEENFVCTKQVKIGKITDYIGRRTYANIFYPENRYRWNSPICPLCGFKQQTFLEERTVESSNPNVKRRILSKLSMIPKLIWPKSTRFYWIISFYQRVNGSTLDKGSDIV